jgi:hypothetical protein
VKRQGLKRNETARPIVQGGATIRNWTAKTRYHVPHKQGIPPIPSYQSNRSESRKCLGLDDLRGQRRSFDARQPSRAGKPHQIIRISHAAQVAGAPFLRPIYNAWKPPLRPQEHQSTSGSAISTVLRQRRMDERLAAEKRAAAAKRKAAKPVAYPNVLPSNGREPGRSSAPPTAAAFDLAAFLDANPGINRG